MAYVRRHWVDYPDTTTPIDADALNNIEDGIEESHNIQLLAVTDTAPSECAEGDKYFDTTTNLIYTATGTDEWGETGETPIYDILYIVLDEQTSYTYNGITLVSVGGGNGGETLPVGSEIDYDGTTVPTGWEEIDFPSVIEAGISANYTTSTTGDEVMPLDTAIINFGNKLTLNTTNHCIVIGAGVNVVKVSAMIRWTSSLVADQRYNVAIRKNNTLVGINSSRGGEGTNQSQAISPRIVEVAEGDNIYLLTRSFDSSGNTVGNATTTTYLQVEAVS